MNVELQENLDDKCLNRHWAETEKFTGADSLLSRVHRGWDIASYHIDSSYFCTTQCVKIYVFTLRKGREQVQMQVVHNPFIERFVAQLDATIIINL